MTVTTKFQVLSVATSLAFEGARVQLAPVSIQEQGGENISLFKGSPVGTIELFVTTSDGINFFEIGKKYIVSFTPE